MTHIHQCEYIVSKDRLGRKKICKENAEKTVGSYNEKNELIVNYLCHRHFRDIVNESIDLGRPMAGKADALRDVIKTDD